ncbi:MAG: hypothetical protein U1E65_07650 [Myxococcota bacterium]
MSQLSDFLSENKISPEAVIKASAALETVSVEERTLNTARANARRLKKTYAELNLGKAKARGRGVTLDVLNRAMAGQPVPRLVRSKIVRAVNDRLVSAKKQPVDWRPLFADAKVKKGKSEKK